MRAGYCICIYVLLTARFSVAGAVQEDRARAERLAAYLKTPFVNQIVSVSADAKTIWVEGRFTEPAKTLQLVEIGMWEDCTDIKAPMTVTALDNEVDGHFRLSFPRLDENQRDRLLSGWAMVKKKENGVQLASAIAYVQQLKPRADLPAAKPKSIKGLCGCPLDHPDMRELGIASVTLNIVLNDLLQTKPGAGRTAYVYSGRKWYVSDQVVARHDREMRQAASLKCMVSAIILIAPVGKAPAGSWVRDAAHPDAQAGGIYVMPNFTSRAGVEAYAAAMNLLAERYSRADGAFGRIHHYILHNEVNSGYCWTNAGDKTLMTYLDLYQKSMRLTWLLANQCDANAKALISLDHHWTKNVDRRGFGAREMLELLAEFSRKEGDYPWGIAFHPYAQDLFNPRSWEDTLATPDQNTPQITFKNIEQLDLWAGREGVRYKGQAREIQLSEQGVNSRDYSAKSLQEQAAGLAYAWKKVAPMKNLTAFQYHHWSDAREEGGLQLGLRKFGDEKGDPLGKKPAWNVYKALGTENEEAATAFAKPMIGIKQWDEIFVKPK